MVYSHLNKARRLLSLETNQCYLSPSVLPLALKRKLSRATDIFGIWSHPFSQALPLRSGCIVSNRLGFLQPHLFNGDSGYQAAEHEPRLRPFGKELNPLQLACSAEAATARSTLTGCLHHLQPYSLAAWLQRKSYSVSADRTEGKCASIGARFFLGTSGVTFRCSFN